MRPRQHSRFWRLCRIYFRRFRIFLWSVVLVLLGALIYINQVGLPDFVKQRLVTELRDRGLDLQFSRFRVRWYQGIVAENVRLGPAGQAFSPQFTFSEVQLQLNSRALAHFHLQVDGLVLQQGRVIIPIPGTNEPPRQLIIQNVQSHLRLLPDDVWVLDDLKATFMGANFQFSASVTNASVIRDWRIFRAGEPAAPGLWDLRLQHLADAVESTRFSGAPQFRLDVRGDASDLRSFLIRVLISAPGAETPWGAFHRGHFKARLFPSTNDALSHAEMSLEAADAQTGWANVTNLNLTVHAVSPPNPTNPVQASLVLSAAEVQTRWASAADLEASAQWVHELTNAMPLAGRGEVKCREAKTQWGEAALVQLSGDLATASLVLPADPGWAWWGKLQPYIVNWHAALTRVQSPALLVDSLAGGGTWRAPQLSISNLHAELYRGRLEASADLDVATRALQVSLASDVDPHAIEPLLGEGARQFLGPFAWNQAPEMRANLAVVLPAWTNRQTDWHAEVQPSMRLDGELKVLHGAAYRGITADTVQSHFSYSNLVWRIPDLTAVRPEGRIEALHQADERTKEFYWRIQSAVDPQAARPLLDTNALAVLDLFNFSQPPVVLAEIRGQWTNPENTTASGQVALTNFTFRGEAVTGVQAALQFTNHLLIATDAQLQRGTQSLSAASLIVDLAAQKIYVTNGFSTADPLVVARAIGPNIYRAIEPYVFGLPPTARVEGVIPLRDETDADLHFDIEGGPFRYGKFNASHIAGKIHWQGQHLALAEVRAECYGGSAAGQAAFDFSAGAAPDYQFNFAATNTRLELLMADLSPRANNPEGLLSGEARITQANTADLHRFAGTGRAELHDGLIWDFPLFGVFSGILNGISPGLGNSRASDASARFLVTNGIIHCDNLEIRSTAFRMHYRGTLDLDGDVNARVDVAPLRDVWLIGPAVSTVFWPMSKLFEYKVTGTLDQPKTEPVNVIPKLIQIPFHPFRTLRDMFWEVPPTNSIFAPLPD